MHRPLTDWNAVPFPDLTPDELCAICDKHGLGGPAIGRLPSTGVVNSIYTLGDDLVLRVPKNMPEALSDTYTESVAVPVAHAAGVRTPALVEFDEAFDILDVPYSIYERVHAMPLQDEDGPWRDVGRDLARLHSVVSDCPDPLGRLDSAGRVHSPAAVVDRWALRCIQRLRPLVREPLPERFLHNDVSPPNVLANGGSYAALIDWGDAAWGDPTLEFSTLPMRAAAEALAGYRDVLPLEEEVAEARILWDHLVRINRQVILDDLRAFAASAPAPWRGLLA